MTETIHEYTVRVGFPILKTRREFADLCNARGIVRAIEVGTDRGLFAEQFLNRWDGEILICVDNWAPYHEMPYDRTPDLMMAVALLAPFRSRIKMVRGESRDLARPIGGYYRPGFVYIDCDHRYDAVKADIEAWYPVLQSGGIFAGHDYMPEHDGVRRAVNEFAAGQGLDVHVTDDLNEYRSWWIEKPA
jgi:Methyltransferase domain